MKDINNKLIQEGNEVVIISGKTRLSAEVDSVKDGKVYFQLSDGKKGFLKEEDASKRVQVVEPEYLQDHRVLLSEVLSETNSSWNVEDDFNVDLDLDKLRIAGIGMDKDHMKIGLNEEQKQTNNIGRICTLLKEAFDVASETDLEMAKEISSLANSIKKQIL